LIDNTGTIAVSGGEKVTRNARHIDMHYHHIRDLIDKKTIEVSHIPTSGLAADGLTKALMSIKFKESVELIGVSKIEVNDSKVSASNSGDNDKNNEKYWWELISTTKSALTKKSILTKKRRDNCNGFTYKREPHFRWFFTKKSSYFDPF
jgi:hypothetical protein